MAESENILKTLEELKSLVVVLVERQAVKEFYTIAEVARVLGKAEFTCREWARLGRINAAKRLSGRGAYPAWVVSADEVRRIQKEGLLPLSGDGNGCPRG